MITLRKFLGSTNLRLLSEGLKDKVSGACRACFHVDHISQAHQKSAHVGNPWRFPHLVGKEHVPVWKVHWLSLMKRKAELEGVPEPGPRCNQLNWDYNAELCAFAHRLKIEVYDDIIRKAFMEPLIDSSDQENNQKLYEVGLQFTADFLRLYVGEAFPRIGKGCATSVADYLMSEDLISYIADNLGYHDLIQTPLRSVTPHVLHRCFLASVAAILYGPGGRLEAAKFLNDFVVTDLLDKDIVHDIWKPRDPMKELVGELASKGLSPPEVRLSKRAGVNSVFPVFFISLFSDKKFLVESAGESVIKAEMDAAELALKKLYGLTVCQFVPSFDLFSKYNFVQKIEQISIPQLQQRDSMFEENSVTT